MAGAIAATLVRPRFALVVALAATFSVMVTSSTIVIYAAGLVVAVGICSAWRTSSRARQRVALVFITMAIVGSINGVLLAPPNLLKMNIGITFAEACLAGALAALVGILVFATGLCVSIHQNCGETIPRPLTSVAATFSPDQSARRFPLPYAATTASRQRRASGNVRDP